MKQLTITPDHLYKLVRLYTFEIGKPMLTYDDFEIAFINYSYYAAFNN